MRHGSDRVRRAAELRATARRCAELPLVIDGLGVEGLELRTRSGWRRRTTVVVLSGAGERGAGEDTTWGPRVGDFWAGVLEATGTGPEAPTPQERSVEVAGAGEPGAGGPGTGGPGAGEPRAGRPTAGGSRPLAARAGAAPGDKVRSTAWSDALGARTVGEFARRLPAEVGTARRWALEGAALSLAARAARLDADALFGPAPAPLSTVVSLGLGRPPDPGRLERVLAVAPEASFKLDLDAPWDDALLARLAGLGRVRVVDAKRRGSIARGRPPLGPAAWSRIARALPGLVVEDPEPDPAVLAALREAGARPALDAELVDAAALRAAVAREGPVAVNVKPARVGGLAALFELYATAADLGLEVYAGGSFELGPGRRQLRLLAARLHPGGPNDAAPPGFHTDPPRTLAPGVGAAPVGGFF